MIARRWRGRVRAADFDAYLAYVEESGIAALRATPGNDRYLIDRELTVRHDVVDQFPAHG